MNLGRYVPKDERERKGKNGKNGMGRDLSDRKIDRGMDG